MAISIITAGTTLSTIAQNANLTRYYHYFGGQLNAATTETDKQANIRPAGTFSNLSVRVSTNSITAASTLTLRNNAADTNVTLSISASGTGTFEDAGNVTATVAAGDNVNYKLVTGASGTSINIMGFAVVFTPTDTTVTDTKLGASWFSGFTTASATRYAVLNGTGSLANTTEANVQRRIKTAGAFKYLDVRVSANARTTTTTVRTRKNTANGAMSVSIGSTATGEFEDTTNSDTIAVDDLVNFQMITGTGTQSITFQHMAVTFESTLNYIPFILSHIGTGALTSSSTTHYFPPSCDLNTPISTTETNMIRLIKASGTLSNFSIHISANTATTATGRVRVNSTDSSISVSIGSGATGHFEDLSNTASITAGDNLTYSVQNTAGTAITIRSIQTRFKIPLLFTATPSETVTISESTFGHKLLYNPVNTYVTRFKKDASGVTNQTQDIYLPFTPKAIIVYSDGNTADNTASAHFEWCLGFSDGTNQTATCTTSQDATTSLIGAMANRNDSVFVELNPANQGVIKSRATCSFDTNKVTFTWVLNDTAATYIHLVAYGGTNITNVKVASTTIGTTATGNVDFTGLGFNPSGSGNSILFTTSTGRTAQNGSSSNHSMSYGCAVSSTKRWTVATQGVTTSDPTASNCYYSNSNCLVGITASSTTGAIDYLADFVSWITDGFRINITDAATSASSTFGYMVIEGGYWDCGNLLSPTTATNDVDTAVTANSQPIRGLMMATVGNFIAGNVEPHSVINIGATDGTNQTSISATDEDDTTTADSYRINNATNIIKMLFPTNGSLFEVASFDSFSTNNFRLDWTTANASQLNYGWVVVADEPPTPVMSQVVRFQKDTSGVTNAIQVVPLNFTPKAIIVYSDGNNVDNTVSDHYQWIQGFSDGTNHSCSCISSDDADAISDTSTTFWDNSVFVRVDDLNNNNVVSRATCSFSTNKVTFTWAVNNTEATYIHIIAYGGSDITNVKVGSGQIGVSASGTRDYTGLGFNPSGNGNSVLFLLENWHTTANNNTVVGNVGKLSFGCAVSSTKRWCVANALEDAQDPSDTWRYYSDTICAVDISISGNVNGYADFSAWITDGFRLNWTETGTLTSTVGLSYLVINGGNWDAGTLTSPGAATGNVDTAVSVNSQPIRGLMITSAEIGSAFANTAMDNAIINVGATDGINNSVIAAIDEDAQATTDSYRVNNTTNIVKTLASNGAAFSTATFDSFSTNNFRLDWIVDGSQKLYGWVVVADEPTSQLFERNVNETAVSVSETLARIQYIFKTISEPSVSVNQTLVRIQYLIKTLSEPSITVSETLARIATYVKPISETAITTNDSIVRLFLPRRTISEPSVSTNDSIARWISVSYTIGEPSITVNDSIQGALFYLRSISEGAISVNDTIARILTAIRAISDPSISTNDTIARIASYLRLISESSVSINEAIARTPTYVKTISNEAAINTNDTIATLLAAVRTIAEPSISVNDTIARIQTILKQISDPSINVNDSILAARLLTGLIIESRVKWYYSLLTRKLTG